MVFNNMGLGAILSFTSGQAVASIARTKKGFDQLRHGVAATQHALHGLTYATAPFAVGVTVAGNEAAHFESQMDAVRATVRGASQDDFINLTQEAKRLGATTKFSANEAAHGMEDFARAGFNATEIMQGMRGVASAAAAGNIGLAESAGVVSSTVRVMGLEAHDASRVADILAVGAAQAGSSVLQSGEAFVYGGAQARLMGLSLEETAAAFGVMAESGRKASAAGSDLTQMLVHLNKPTKESASIMAQLGINMHKVFQAEHPLVALAEQFGTKIKAIKDPITRGRVMTELFGVRGQKAFAALTAQGPKTHDFFVRLIKNMQTAAGAAEKMAAIRLDNFLGQVTKLQHAAQAVSMELFLPILKFLTPLMHETVVNIMGVARALQFLRGGIRGTYEEVDKQVKEWQSLSDINKQIALGVSQAIDTIQGAVHSLADTFAEGKAKLIDWLGPEAITKISKFATLFVIAAAAITPVAVALIGLGFITTTLIIPAVEAAVAVFGGLAQIALGPVGLALAAVAGGIYLLKRNNESFADLAVRLWETVSTAVTGFWEESLYPLLVGLKQGLLPAFEQIKQAGMEIFASLKFAFGDLTKIFGDGTSGMQTDWMEVGRTAGAIISFVVGAVADTAATLAMWVSPLIKGFIILQQYIGTRIVDALKRVINIGKTFVSSFDDMFSGKILDGVVKLGKAILESLIVPLRMLVQEAVKLADSFHFNVPKAVREFADKGLEPLMPQRKKTESILDKAAQVKAAGVPNLPDIKMSLTDNRKVEVNANLKVDGTNLAIATAKHQREINERSGFRATPWQRRAVLEHGAVLAPQGSK